MNEEIDDVTQVDFHPDRRLVGTFTKDGDITEFDEIDEFEIKGQYSSDVFINHVTYGEIFYNKCKREGKKFVCQASPDMSIPESKKPKYTIKYKRGNKGKHAVLEQDGNVIWEGDGVGTIHVSTGISLKASKDGGEIDVFPEAGVAHCHVYKDEENTPSQRYSIVCGRHKRAKLYKHLVN